VAQPPSVAGRLTNRDARYRDDQTEAINSPIISDRGGGAPARDLALQNTAVSPLHLTTRLGTSRNNRPYQARMIFMRLDG
jgi:hypothetical protein